MNIYITIETMACARAALLQARDLYEMHSKHWWRYENADQALRNALDAALAFDDEDVPALLRKQA